MSCSVATFAFAPVLLADWISTTIWLVVISIGIINQLMGEKKKNAAKRAPPPADGAKPGAGGKGLLDEVERFLQEARKATEQAQNRPAQQQPKQFVAPQQQPQKQRRSPQQQREQQQRAAQKKQQRPSKRVTQDDARKEGSSLASRQLSSKLELSSEEETFRGTVSEHVSHHLDTSRFAERAGRLSHIQQTVEADIGGHVRSVFDHQVGSLAQSGTPRDPNEAIPPESVRPLDQIASMLRDPQSMRTAIILQEILRPPTERWS